MAACVALINNKARGILGIYISYNTRQKHMHACKHWTFLKIVAIDSAYFYI